MIIVPGRPGKDLCDSHLGMTRRDILRVGGSSLMGLSLGSLFQLQAASAATTAAPKIGGAGWGKAKSIIMVYLQGGPSHLDLWDPKDNVPDNVRSEFKPIDTKVPGIRFTEILPKLAQITDKFTLIRSMSYTPNGLFNHTAAIYQMMTGYTTDKVSPSGQLEPPSPKDFPNFGSNLDPAQAADRADAPVRDAPAAAPGVERRRQGGPPASWARRSTRTPSIPTGDDMDMAKMSRIKVDDLQLRPEVFSVRLERRAKLRDALNSGMPVLEKAVTDYNLDEYYDRALKLIVSGRAREAFNLEQETPKTRDAYGRNTFGQSCPARASAGRGRDPRGRGGLAQGGQLRQPLVGPPRRPDPADEESVRPDARHRPLRPAYRPRRARDARRDLVVAVGEFGRSPQKGVSTSGNGNSADGRDHWPYCYTAVVAGAGISAATCTASRTRPVRPRPKTRSIPASCWRRSIGHSGSTRRPSSITT